jgi:hypothetical protein
MSNFKLDQGSSSIGQHANLFVPGCGLSGVTNESAIVYVDIKAGKPVLVVYGDINSEEPTHTIDLSKSLLTNSKEATEDVSEPEVPATPEIDGGDAPEEKRSVRRRR